MKKVFKNEGDVKKFVKAVLNAYGDACWWFMPPANGYGRAGIPDFVGSVYGQAFVVETKFGYNQPTANQQREINNAQLSGAVAWVVNDKNYAQFEVEFNELVLLLVTE